jgi:hypothetical protein
VDAALAGLAGTAVGALAGLVGSGLTAWYQLRAERQRAANARHDEMVKAGRQALVQLTQLLTTGTYAIAWLGWSVSVQSPEEIRREVDTYNTKLRELIPQLLAAEAAAASVSDNAFDQIDPLVNELLILDARVGTAAQRLETNHETAAQQIADAKRDAVEMQERVIRVIRALLRPDFG